jgi:protein SDA1
MEIFMAAPTSATDSGIVSLRELIDFVSHVADCYLEITKGFSEELIDVLIRHHPVLEPELREKIVGSIVLLRRKDIIDSTTYGSQSKWRGDALIIRKLAANILPSPYIHT